MTSASNISNFNTTSIIPLPASIKEVEGKFILNNNTVIVADGEHQQRSAQFFIDYLNKYYGISLFIVKKQDKMPNNSILFTLNSDNKKNCGKAGSYTVSVTNSNIILEGNDNSPEGLFYAMQSLIQLLPIPDSLLTSQHSDTPHSFYTIPLTLSTIDDEIIEPEKLWENNPIKELQIPCVEVEDAPAFEYRGQHLDVVRHTFPAEYIKKFIDYLAYHKMNYFHWHLTDDQGWRIEIKSHPKLNEIGSWRESTIIGIFPGTGVNATRYGGYYTQQEIKEIIKYASDRYITVVPEIDIPGHSMATLACYPEFSTDPNGCFKPATTWELYNRQNNVLAPTDKLFSFLSDVFNELIDLFPSKYIHLGGDEACKKWWQESPATQEFIKRHSLGDEKGLQRYFVEYVCDIITKRGRTPLAWDDIVPDGKMPDDLIIINWQNEGHDITAVNNGHKVIQTPMEYCYFNYRQIEDEMLTAHMHFNIPLEKTYSYNPVPEFLAPEQASLIIGAQGCMWTEYYQNIQKAEYGIFPRMTAMAEVLWTPKELKDFANFESRLAQMYKRYNLWGTNHFTL